MTRFLVKDLNSKQSFYYDVPEGTTLDDVQELHIDSMQEINKPFGELYIVELVSFSYR